jgi:hypothetical protein
MLIPTKHTNFSKSLFGFGSYILNKIEHSKSIDELWDEYRLDYRNKIYPAKHSFDNLLLTLTFLYSIGIIEEQDGGVMRCN